jgi:hypothetical protein
VRVVAVGGPQVAGALGATRSDWASATTRARQAKAGARGQQQRAQQHGARGAGGRVGVRPARGRAFRHRLERAALVPPFGAQARAQSFAKQVEAQHGEEHDAAGERQSPGGGIELRGAWALPAGVPLTRIARRCLSGTTYRHDVVAKRARGQSR